MCVCVCVFVFVFHTVSFWSVPFCNVDVFIHQYELGNVTWFRALLFFEFSLSSVFCSMSYILWAPSSVLRPLSSEFCSFNSVTQVHLQSSFLLRLCVLLFPWLWTWHRSLQERQGHTLHHLSQPKWKVALPWQSANVTQTQHPSSVEPLVTIIMSRIQLMLA